MKYKIEDYENTDPLYGDFDVDIQNRTQKMVNCRKPHVCWAGADHTINPGEQALRLSGFLEGAPISFYYCLPCMDSWIDEEHGDHSEEADNG